MLQQGQCFSPKDFCDLAEFKWHELIDELLDQQPLLADVQILVISTVFGMLMNTGYQELSLQLVSSKDNRNDFSPKNKHAQNYI
ncbi:hypothetical protein DPMN_022743 [Dreissena polymorpha]|uniref:Uncharacterized protein n=1 Tax=Dreissena polymorpha TaxID=45954 RepID=A0A9D4NPS1_DREPO|nr:hypothetical protein DPMN_022743 [Dreissena polymorpha]